MKDLQPDGTWKKIPTGTQNQKFTKDRCVYCGTFSKLTKDHVIPSSRGGAKHISNLQTLCEFCNGFKSNYTEDEIVTTFLDIKRRGVWYDWEERFSVYLNWLEVVSKERGHESKILCKLDTSKMSTV